MKHRSYAWGIAVISGRSSGYPTLYRLYFLDVSCCMWRPHSRGILYLWAYKCLISCGFQVLFVYFNIPLEKSQHLICFLEILLTWVPQLSPCNMLQTAIDFNAIPLNVSLEHSEKPEYHCRRLCYALHCERYKRLSLIPKRKHKK